MELLSDNEDHSDSNVQLKINKKFAGRYEEQERFKELQKAQAILDQESESESDSETEDEDADQLSPGLDLKIMQTINMIKKKDPKIYAAKEDWFVEPEDDEENESTAEASKKRKYKDVLRDQLLNEGSGADITEKKSGLVYNEEQEKLRQNFLKSANKLKPEDDTSDDDLLQVKKKSKEDLQVEEQQLQETLKEMQELNAKEKTESDAFLMEYLTKKMWKSDPRLEFKGNDAQDYEEEEEELEKVDRFESKYNFRYEELKDQNEEVGMQVIGHARNVEGSLRRVDDKRKKEREARAERKEKEKRQKEAEIRRLKNLKREELNQRLRKIGQIGGLRKLGVIDEDLLDEDWDPAKHEALMRQQFDDEYYGEGDEDFQLGRDDLGNEYDYEGVDMEVGDEVEAEEAQYDDAQEDGDAEEELTGEQQAMVTSMMDELYQLDYEDIVAGMPCRFKYKQVEPDNYGLSAEEILFADDADLNKYVSLKHISAYITKRVDAGEEKMKKKRKKLRSNVKERLKELQQQEEGKEKATQPIKKQELENAEEELEAEEAQEGQQGSKKRRRRKKKQSNNQTSAEVNTPPPAVESVSNASNNKESKKKHNKQKNKKPKEQTPAEKRMSLYK